MADIFISYKREDRPVAERLSIALEQLGFDVWWDFDLLSGEPYRKVIRAVIDQCKAAVVLWSVRAIESDFVMDEATYAKSQGKLCPARIDGVDLPFGFGAIHTDDLSNWDGELSHPGFQAMVRAVESRVGRKGRLGSSPRTADSQAASAELEAFKAAQIAGNASALKAFISAYPRGMFAGFVRGQLETIKAEAQSTPVARTDLAEAPSQAMPRAPAPPPSPLQTSPPPSDHEDSAPKKRAPFSIIAIGIAAAVMVIGGAGYWVFQQQESRDRAEQQAYQEREQARRERQARLAAEQRVQDFATQSERDRATLSAAQQRNLTTAMAGEWHKVSGPSGCAAGYRISSVSGQLSLTLWGGSSWNGATAAGSLVDDSTLGFGSRRIQLDGARLRVTRPDWSEACSLERGAPSARANSTASTATPATTAAPTITATASQIAAARRFLDSITQAEWLASRGISRRVQTEASWPAMLAIAEQGDARAQTLAASAYMNGNLGLEQNFAEALRLARLATAQNAPTAPGILAVCYLNGYGVTQDDATALRYARQSANAGSAYGQTMLGYMFYAGRGVAANDGEALRLFRLAAGQQYPNAQFYLGNMYAEGRGVTADQAEARRLWQLAAQQGVTQAEEALRASDAARRTADDALRNTIEEARRNLATK